MNKLSPRARALLELARDADDPTLDQRVRADAAVRIGLALHGVSDLPPLEPPGATPSAAEPRRFSRFGSTTSWKLSLAAAALIAAGVLGANGVQRIRPAPQRAARASATPASAPAPAPGQATLPPAMRAQAIARRGHGASAGATAGAITRAAHHGRAALQLRPSAALPASRSTLEAEVQLIGSANGLIRARRFDEAMGVLDAHARRFPRGALREEREALRVLSLCGADPSEHAQEAVQHFLNGAPRSVVAQRVRAACAQGDGASQ